MHIGHLTLNIYAEDAASILDKLSIIEKKVDQLMKTEQDTLTAIKKIDDATTAIGANVGIITTTTTQIATVGGQIDNEVKDILAQLAAAKANGVMVPDSVVDAITALGTKGAAIQTAAQASADALVAQKDALVAIATQGATNPVPVPVPPPPPPPAF